MDPSIPLPQALALQPEERGSEISEDSKAAEPSEETAKAETSSETSSEIPGRSKKATAMTNSPEISNNASAETSGAPFTKPCTTSTEIVISADKRSEISMEKSEIRELRSREGVTAVVAVSEAKARDSLLGPCRASYAHAVLTCPQNLRWKVRRCMIAEHGGVQWYFSKFLVC